MANEEGRIRKLRIFYLLIMLVTLAIAVYLYLSWTAYTSLGTRLITATAISVVFTIGYSISNIWRISTLVFVMQLCSPFGVLIIFDTLSWFLLILPSIEVVTEVMEIIAGSGEICEFAKNDTLTKGQVFLGSLHYAPIFCFALIFLFCVCCVIFHENPVPNHQVSLPIQYSGMLPPPPPLPEGTKEKKKTKFLRLLRGIGDLINHGQFGVFVLSVTLTKWRSYAVKTLDRLLQNCPEKLIFSKVNGTLFIFYLVGSAICVLVLCFVPKFNTRRAVVIQKLKLKVRQERQPCLFFLRPKASSTNRSSTGHQQPRASYVASNDDDAGYDANDATQY